ncbi:MAG TPA: indolepyruvate oxidoreductase subunit beta family protein [Azospirillum sp.]|nr:indolepyruvate oxidoreductase subunit beta family protein [Azospirillum sp.]
MPLDLDAPSAQAAQGQDAPVRAITIAVVAMGGEGGGVLSDWIVDLAEHAGCIAQSTSVPGVAQRTGATIYYIELFPEAAAKAAGRDPVLSLTPVPGDVDIVLASELMEAGRAVQRGLVTPDRTVLIASTHRVYSIRERTAPADGRVDAEALIAAGKEAARRHVFADMAHIAESTGSVISAALFGALAGSQALPFERAQFEAAIRRGGVGVEASLAAFSAGYERAQGGDAAVAVPEETTETIREGVKRLTDYQDPAYAQEYLERLAPFRASGHPELLDEVARHLALWMSYEDTIRVADLKTRASRFARVCDEVRLGKDQILQISEYMHPRIEEVADTLPAGLGRWLLGSTLAHKVLAPLTRRGRVVRTSSLGGFLLLYAVAGLRPWRRGTLRFQCEHERIRRWLDLIRAMAPEDPALAVEIARAQRLVKGYSDTHQRGTRNFERLMALVPAMRRKSDPAGYLRVLCDAALADDTGAALEAALAEAHLEAPR